MLTWAVTKRQIVTRLSSQSQIFLAFVLFLFCTTAFYSYLPYFMLLQQSIRSSVQECLGWGTNYIAKQDTLFKAIPEMTRFTSTSYILFHEVASTLIISKRFDHYRNYQKFSWLTVLSCLASLGFGRYSLVGFFELKPLSRRKFGEEKLDSNSKRL